MKQINGEKKKTIKYAFESAYKSYSSWMYRITNKHPLGTNIYKRDWDVLIILDSCRVDAIKEVKEEYDFINSLNKITSVGSTSSEWLMKTFTNDYLDQIKKTAYVTGNAYSEEIFSISENNTNSIVSGLNMDGVVSYNDFHYLEEVWRMVDERFSFVGPRMTTDRSISVARSTTAKKLIIHYMYPHDPYPRAPNSLQKPFSKLRDGSVSKSKVWDLYIDNLRYVLDDVELLLKNIDSERVIITSDHGEAFGEYGCYKHKFACPLPSVKRVPWIKTTATNTNSYEPKYEAPESKSDKVSAEERLKQLGYL